MNLNRLLAAVFVVTVFGASPTFGAPLVRVSGKVCDTSLELALIAPPNPGVVRCTPSDPRPQGVKVMARSAKTNRLRAQTRTRSNGTYQLKLPPGKYIISVERGGYDLTVQVGSQDIKIADFFRGRYF